MKRVWNLVWLIVLPLMAQNQTETLSPVLSEASLPFTLEIAQAPFQLPKGLQSYASGVYKGKWILIAGRTNGLHDFANVGNNFPPQFQNTTIYVIDPVLGASMSRTLVNAGLSQAEIDTLSVTSPEFCQKGHTLYIVGGYGINTTTGQMETKSTLTVVHLKKLIKWVQNGSKSTLRKAIRQTSHPLLQVTGGTLFRFSSHDPFLLIMGQNFANLYVGASNGVYTQQVRRFWLNDDRKHLSITPKAISAIFPDYRRRDLNVVPILRRNQPAYVALAGVFTLDTGVWTVPVTILPDGSSTQPDPEASDTFKQAMNHYECPAFGLYSTRSKNMYIVLPGGISYGFFSGGTFQTDAEIPFINQVTTIKIDKQDRYTQYLMHTEYPLIASTGSNPGNTLLFGAEAQFFLHADIATFANNVIRLDKITKPTVIGYLVGGIMSTLPNTNTFTDSTASPYIFTVKLIPK